MRQRRALGYAIYRLLQQYGVGVCDTEFGRRRGGRPGWPAHLDELRDRFDLVVQIIDRRRELHLTQQQVAAASGLHQSVVSRIEQGVANPTARTLAALARALDARLTLSGRQV